MRASANRSIAPSAPLSPDCHQRGAGAQLWHKRAGRLARSDTPMANSRFAWGIDVGNRALKAVKLVRDGAAGMRIDDVDVIEHEHILSDAGDNKETLVTAALNTFAMKHPEKGGAVAIGVSGQSS